MIGDVCGHGPDEAALGVELRIAWRALTLAGLCGDELLSTLQQVLEHERAERGDLRDALHRRHRPGRPPRRALPGRPPVTADRPPGPAARGCCPYENGGPALGLLPRRPLAAPPGGAGRRVEPDAVHRRADRGPRRRRAAQRLGQDGMVEMVNRQLAAGLSGEELLEAAVTEVRRPERRRADRRRGGAAAGPRPERYADGAGAPAPGPPCRPLPRRLPLRPPGALSGRRCTARTGRRCWSRRGGRRRRRRRPA